MLGQTKEVVSMSRVTMSENVSIDGLMKEPDIWSRQIRSPAPRS